jgi:hypothetical protein
MVIKDSCLSFLFSRASSKEQASFWRRLGQDDTACFETLRQGALFPYVYALLLQQAPPVSMPTNLLAALRHAYLCAVQQSVVQDGEATQVLEILVRAGLTVVLLKGADLRLRVYLDPATRPMTDLDILVPPEQAGWARAILTDLGYRPMEPEPRPGFQERFTHAVGLLPPPGLTLQVDLHWEIREGEGYYCLPCEFLKPSLQKVVFHNLPLRVLSPEHLLAHLCLHTYWEFTQWRQFLDLALVIQHLPVNWEQFAVDVKACHCQVPVSRVLDMGHCLQPDLVPSPAALGLADSGTGWVERLVLNGRVNPLIPYLAVFVHHPPAHWLPFLRAKVWPDREFLVAKFGSASRGRYLRQFVRKFQDRAGDLRDSGETPEASGSSLF